MDKFKQPNLVTPLQVHPLHKSDQQEKNLMNVYKIIITSIWWVQLANWMTTPTPI